MVRTNGQTRLGRFRDELAGARELFGEYAWLNFPEGIDTFLAAENPAVVAAAAAAA